MLDRVGLPEQSFPLDRYPHELSGGQRQRVVIAIAMRAEAEAADRRRADDGARRGAAEADPGALARAGRGGRMALLLISHDLAVVTDMADRVAVMRGGAVMESGETVAVLSAQQHPYTRQLAQASMHVPPRRAACAAGRPGRLAAGRGRGARQDLCRPPALAVSPRRAGARRRRRVASPSRRGQSVGLVGELGLREIDARPAGAGARPADRGDAALPRRRR